MGADLRRASPWLMPRRAMPRLRSRPGRSGSRPP